MHIDWFTFAAQIVNFFVLVWILKYVLYQPILDALETRRRTVEAAVSDAASAREAADRDRKALSEERDAYEHQKAAMQRQLTEELEAERVRRLEEARRELEEMSTNWKRRIDEEKETAGRLLADLAGTELMNATRKMMRDLSDTDLDEAMARAFLRRWRETPPGDREHRKELIAACKTPIVIRTSSSLPDGLRNEITHTIVQDVGTPDGAKPVATCTWETAPELIGGIEVHIGDRRIAWTFSEYLATLEERIHELLQERTA
ncbi:hypothetical protein KBA41_01290 [Candidatus Ozemobacteraceae bacterium]|nr:hypothetical protein [Candidatus Ozemobacteraceae bacterium]